MTSAVVVAARRTPIGTAGRALAGVTVDRLAAPVLEAVMDDLGGDVTARVSDAAGGQTDRHVRWTAVPGRIDDVVLGNCMGPGGNIARVSALAAGLGDAVPGVTIDRQCGSGLAAILQAGQAIRAGDAALVLAGGAESASTAPIRAFRPAFDGAQPVPYQRAPFTPPEFGDPDMGAAADALAAACGVSRNRQDDYAVASHAKALAAREAGRFDAELVPVGRLDHDERPRPLRESVLARMPAAFVPGGSVTAGNSCPVSDGAAVVGVIGEDARGGRPGLRLVSGAIVGCDPRLPGWGPVPAVERVLRSAGVKIRDVAVVEIVEAFAGQVLAVTDALGLDPLSVPGAPGDIMTPGVPGDTTTDVSHNGVTTVCPDGGALALGHPWGATGAVTVVRLFSRLVRGGAPAGTLGLATAAVGGGLGVAALFEVVR
ncbi:thiolase family protein [Phytoactinopolyspora endophytica]|uniref:thiolase family protein n=1 Tax=Phytoactinopolyspora endophytica TaxID=1642495 RepID=UPI00101DA60E|nr:thiolase family protein [Phytoactinopolyspora endophytica]